MYKTLWGFKLRRYRSVSSIDTCNKNPVLYNKIVLFYKFDENHLASLKRNLANYQKAEIVSLNRDFGKQTEQASAELRD